ncbi:MAG: indolepyruvate ferredoxin oxidoreductase family protein [Burkholderiaceae bacterium]|nr:MAG: indolepyruvate ferredoxin oxidoreductase family protein [Burkholderiaceae bacterium]
MGSPEISLQDKYQVTAGRVYMTGTQALIRMLMFQHLRDQAAGLNTAGFVSGYRGSPLGSVDLECWRAAKYLEQHRIKFSPGINEELGATAVWGTQQVTQDAQATVDGVFALWYGKGPGVDRAIDPIKHGNAAGSSKHGGVLLVCGDDHACKSSTLPHQSEHVLIAAMVPVLNPSGVREFIEFGLHGFALSRFSGCWVGFKTVSDTVESTASFEVDPLAQTIIIPSDFTLPPDGVSLRWPDVSLEQERRLHEVKLPAALAYARANRLNRIVIDTPQATLGIITTGKSYLDTLQAFDLLGLDEAQIARHGIRLLKIGMSWPLDPQIVQEFARGLDEILVVEEKRDVLEMQVKDILFNTALHPRITGKTADEGVALLSSGGELSAAEIALTVAARLQRHQKHDDVEARARAIDAGRKFLDTLVSQHQIKTQRMPVYCSGCPHNTSTRVPEGSRALAGIGCHYMAIWMERGTGFYSQMGGEGVAWIGQSPFTSTPHMFVNLGDGTYFHSGILALRAAVAAKVNVTYKILFNDAVAMTGGQPVEGILTVPHVAQQVYAEGVREIVIVSDAPEKYDAEEMFPPETQVRHRDELDAIQRHLREVPGVTVLIYDQTCAAEKRRRRKRGKYPDPAHRIVINEEVCEGCGDCGEQSNCVSIVPVETELGRKRAIDQSSCNKDYSCIKGFCPSFVSVVGGQLREHTAQSKQTPPAPKDFPVVVTPPLDRPYNILVTGVGGTGVVTIGAILGMAAHLEGKGALLLDMAGLAQKGGAVRSHVRLGPTTASLHAARIADGDADLLLACDAIVCATPETLTRLSPHKTRAVINSDVMPTSDFIHEPDWEAPLDDIVGLLQAACRSAHDTVPAATLATALLEDSIATNMFMLGYALQKGWVPLHPETLERAIVINGARVQLNLDALAWGRQAAVDQAAVKRAAGGAASTQVHFMPRRLHTLETIVKDRVQRLTAYQNAAYAQRYKTFVETCAAQEQALGLDGRFGKAVASNLYKLMAIKDEYEVARLYTETDFRQKIAHDFEGDYHLEFHLAPPLFSRIDPNTGRPQKLTFGRWMFIVFKVLTKLRFLRGSALDIFARSEERRSERALLAHYIQLMQRVSAELQASNLACAIELARLPEQIRGFGPVKAEAMQRAQEKEAVLLRKFVAASTIEPLPKTHSRAA